MRKSDPSGYITKTHFDGGFRLFFRIYVNLGFVPIIRFLAITKNGATFNVIIVVTNDWRGKWNRHAVDPSDNFYTGAIF